MSIETSDPSHETFWTLERVISVAVSLMMISAPLAAAPAQNPVNANAPAPATTAAPSGLTDLPPQAALAPLKDANGASFKLADFFGKVVVVNFWATWCGPCRREIPELIKLHNEFHSRGVEMIGLSTENPDASAEKVLKFIQDFKIDYRIGWAPREVAAPLMQGHEAIPQIFVISPDARILKRFVGFSGANTAALKQALEDALKENAPL